MANRPVIRRRSVVGDGKSPEPAKAKLVVHARPSKSVEEDDEDEDVKEEVEVEDDVEVEDEEEEEEEEEEPRRPAKKAAPAPVKKAAPAPVKASKPAKKVEEEPEEDEEVQPKKSVKVKPVDVTVASAIAMELLVGMSEGQSIVITRHDINKWSFTNTDAIATKKAGVTGKAYWDEVLDPAYQTWEQEWSQLTQDERIKKAKKAGVTWQEDKDPRVNIMRCTAAYREALGIEKYKPEYRSRSARAALK